MYIPDSVSLSVLVVNWLSGGTGKGFHHTGPSLDHFVIILILVCVTEEQQDNLQTPYMYFPDTIDILSRHTPEYLDNI